MAVGNTTSLGLLSLAGVKPYELKKNEEYMNDAQKEHFTKILKAWHSQIMDEAARTKNQMQEDVTNFADPADRATQELNKLCIKFLMMITVIVKLVA